MDAQREPSSGQAADEGQITWNHPSFPSRMPSTHWCTVQRESLPIDAMTGLIPLLRNSALNHFFRFLLSN